jgi:hypothetical protein
VFDLKEIKWEVDCKNGYVYKKEKKLNTIVNEESEVRGKKIHCAMILPYVASSNFKLNFFLGPPSRISHLDANKFMEHAHQSYAHITF